MKKFSVLMLLVLSSSAFADQCMLINKKLAKDSLEFFKPGTKIGHICEPCGETKVKAQTVKSSSIKKVGQYSQVVVNGKDVDLAYVYYLANGKTYYNVAGLVGCPASGVSFNLAK